MDVIAGNWRKSSYSAYNGSCAEAGSFRMSSRSAGAGECAEVGSCRCGVAVRDSKDKDWPGSSLRRGFVARVH